MGHKCSSILADSAGRALGGVISKCKTLRDCGYKTFTKLFDAGVLSILNYGAEIWGYGNFSKCDNVINRAMRYFLGVHKFAPTAGLYGDMAWLSLKFSRYISMLRFWNILIKMENTRLAKRVFLWCHDNPDNTYCEDIRKISECINMIEVYNNKMTFSIDDVTDRCRVMMTTELQYELQTKPKLRTYKIFKNCLTVEPYVLYHGPKWTRSICAQFRMGILPLHMETGRYKTVTDQETGRIRSMKVGERVCLICKSNIVEDEKHFVFHCPMYITERNKFYDSCSRGNNNFIILNDDHKLKYIMKYELWKVTTNYIISIWEERKSLEYS